MLSSTYVSDEKIGRMMSYETFQRMIRFRSPRTIAGYAVALHRVLEEKGLSPDAIVEVARAGDEVEIGDLKAKILEGYKSSVRYVLNNDLNRLLKSNRVKNLPEEGNRHYVPLEEHEPYTKEDIRSMLSWVNTPRGKLLIHSMAESGLRIHHVLGLKWKHVSSDYAKGKGPLFIKFSPQERQTSKSAGYTFLSQTCYELLKECVEKDLVKTEPESYLFPGSPKGRKQKNRGGPMTYASVHDILELARAKAKIGSSKSTNHAFRSYFSHQLIKAEIPDPIRKRMMGHSLGSGDVYVTKDPEELRTYYNSAWPFVNPETGQVEPETIASWQQEKTELQNQLKEIPRLLDEMVKMRTRLEQLEQQQRKS